MSDSDLFMERSIHNEILNDNPWQIKQTNYAIENGLASVNLPPAYEKLYRSCQPVRGRVPLSQVKIVLEGSGLSISTVDQILSMTTTPSDTSVSKITFNLILALVALSQKNMAPSLENVQQHMSDLPTPVFTILETSLASAKLMNSFPSPQSSMHTASTRQPSRVLYDPWQMQPDGQSHPELADQASSVINSTAGLKSLKSINQSLVETYNDTITISQDSILEGIIFKHVNYIVQSERLGSKVLRRYSHFYQLHQFLKERYTYRLVLDIPPKRLGASEDFLQKRARGLSRFLNFIVNHPILGNDEVVRHFLTETNDFSFSKSEKISEEDEITQRISSSFQEDQNMDLISRDVPSNLDNQLEKIHDALIKLVPYYGQVIQIIDTMTKRLDANGHDLHQLGQLTIKLGLNDYESNEQVSDWYLFSAKFPNFFSYLAASGKLTQNFSNSLNIDLVERLKLIRDLSSSFLSLLDRAQSQPHIDISKINRRINLNIKTVELLMRENPQSPEIPHLKTILDQDKQLVAEYKVRSQFIHRALWSELCLYRDVHLATTSRLLQELMQHSLKLANQSISQLENLESITFT